MKQYWSILAGALVAGPLLAACGGSHGLSSSTSIIPPAASRLALNTSGTATEKVLHRFQGGMDGQYPQGALVAVKGVLYGTTTYGGGSTCADSESSPGCGTIFRVDESGSGYQVLYRFPASAIEGSIPLSGVVDVGDTLYGTTDWGGSSAPCRGNTGCGSVFKYGLNDHANAFGSILRFNGTDGFAVNAGVIDGSGSLYGATLAGGTSGNGTVFRLDGRNFSNFGAIHDFAGGNDGSAPEFAPTNVNGTLYGTTVAGGGTECKTALGSGCGTIYSYSKKNGYRVLYRFKGGADGSGPINVIDVHGTLYGTTSFGGDAACALPYGSGCGVIFKISVSGNELKRFHVLYSFTKGRDGWSPTALSAAANGKLYGATTYGGDPACSNGCGTVFQVSTSDDAYTELYSFKGSSDGAHPGDDGPVDVSGILYGTTFNGGSGCHQGCGTVYAITPP